MNTVDSSGEILNIDKNIKDQPEAYADSLESLFYEGNLNAIQYICKKLITIKPDDGDIRALLSISFASAGKIDDAEKQFSTVSKRNMSPFYRYCAEAMILKAKGKYQEARSACAKALAQDSRHPYAHNIMGRINYDLGQIDSALSSFKKAISLNPNFVPAYINLGVNFYFKKNYSESIRYFNEAIQRSPRSFDAHYGIAIVLEASGNETQAIQHYRQCLAIKHDSKDALLQLGLLELKNGMYDQSLSSAKKLETMNHPGANIIIAEASMHLNDLKTAKRYLNKLDEKNLTVRYLNAFLLLFDENESSSLKAFQDVLKEDSKVYGAYLAKLSISFKLGKPITLTDTQIKSWSGDEAKMLYFYSALTDASQGRWDKAHKQLIKAQGILGGFSMDGLSAKELQKNELPSLMLGVLYSYLNFPAQAARELDQALVANSSSPFSNYFAAQPKMKLGNKEKALAYYAKAVEKAPRFFAALYAAGELEAGRGNFDNALSFYTKASQVKKDFGLLIKLGLIYENKNDGDKAADFYNQAIKTAPDNFIGYNQLAWLYAKQGVHLDEAMSLAKKADNMIPGNGSIQDTLGWIYYHKKDFPSSLKYLESAIKVSPEDSTVLYHLGVVYEAMGKTKEAHNTLKKALSVGRPFAEAEKTKALIKKLEQ